MTWSSRRRCCEVAGVDLIVHSVYIDWPEELRDAQTGLFVVLPDLDDSCAS